MKIIHSILILLLISLSSFAQELDKKLLIQQSKILILGSGKLGTISDKKEILNEPDPKVTFYQTEHQNIYFLEIVLYDKFVFYISYNKKKDRFYRLGGFDCNCIDGDITSFVKDLDKIEKKELRKTQFLGLGVKMSCIVQYISWNGKRKMKKEFKCFKMKKQ